MRIIEDRRSYQVLEVEINGVVIDAVRRRTAITLDEQIQELRMLHGLKNKDYNIFLITGSKVNRKLAIDRKSEKLLKEAA